MAKQVINVGTAANDKKGDSLRAAFQKVNTNFTELYTALGINADVNLNLGAFEFAGSTMTTTDSSAIVIDQATTITSNLSVGGDVLPSVANGGDLGSSTLPWRSLYVSNNTIYIGGTAVGLDANGNLTTGGTVVGSTPAWNSITGKPTFATVATSGAYADLTGKPTIPTLGNISNGTGPTTDPNSLVSSASAAFINFASDLDGAFGLGTNDGSLVKITTDGGASSFEFTADNGAGSIKFPDGTVQTTAAEAFSFSVAADDSTQRAISNNELIKFIGAGGITTSSDAEGYITITGSGGSVSSLVNSTKTLSLGNDGSLTSNGALTLKTPDGIPTSVSNWQGQGGWNQNTYTNLATTGGTGTGLTVDVAANGAGYILIGAITINTPGTGYTAGDVITIDNENSLPGTFTIGVAGTRSWAFGTSGSLTLPIGVSIDSSVSPLYPKIIADSGKLFSVQGQGSTGSAALAWSLNPNTDTQYAAVGVNRGGGDDLAKVVLTAGNTTATLKVWKFDQTGAFTFPDGTIQTTAAAPAFSFSVAADDSTQREISNNELVKFIGAGGVTTASDAEGNITINYVQGDIRSDSNINIDINLSDSTLRRWQFGEDGSLTLPAGGNISEGGGFTGAIKLTPAGGANEYQALLIYPTAGDGNHIHLTAGGGTTELYLGDDLHYVKLASDGVVSIQADDGVASSAAWTFGTDGAITTTDVFTVNVPGGAVAGITGIVPNSDSRDWDSNYGSNLATTGGTGTGLTVNVNATAGPLGNDYASVSINQPGTGYTSGDVINVENYNDEGGAPYASYVSFTVAVAGNNSWQLQPSGLKFPDATVQSTAWTGFSVAADDSTQRLINAGEVVKFIGAGTVTTASDAEGNITITGTGGTSIPAVVTTGAAGVGGQAHVKVQFTVASATTVTAVGVTVIGISTPASGQITLSGSPGTGSFDIVAATNVQGETFILMPFATNASGTGYGAPIAGTGTDPCLVRGTLITMADMSRVAVENILYSDNILVWDFDLGEFASAKPLWIKKTQTTVVSCLLTFSDHSELRIVGDSPKAHRIFNKEAGKFTYGSMPETPIGTTTFNDQGEEITLISKEWIVGEVEFYNVMTDYHMNLFANSILTSMRYNNLYPITDMKFVKDSRTLRTADDYPNVEERLYKGFRLAEQTQSVEEIETHIQWLLTLEVERETECV